MGSILAVVKEFTPTASAFLGMHYECWELLNSGGIILARRAHAYSSDYGVPFDSMAS